MILKTKRGTNWSRIHIRILSSILLAYSISVFPSFPPVGTGQERPGGSSNRTAGNRLDRILGDSLLRTSFVGIKVVRVETGEIVYQRNAGKLFHPASNMKLLTSGAALAALPAGFRFRTSLYCDAGIVDSVLEGNLYVRGGGDPLMELPDLDSLAGIVASAGIRKIAGTITGDVTMFDTVQWGKGWMWDDEPEPEEAFLTPLTLHGNSVTFRITPGDTPGDTLRYELDPPAGFMIVENLTRTLPRGGNDTLIVSRESGGNRFVLTGGLSAGSAEEEKTLSVHDPARVFLETMKERFTLRGISNDRPVMLDSTRGKVFLGSIERSLDAVLSRINKESDNIAAENLLKILGLMKEGPPGSGKGGLRSVKEYLASTGADPASLILADGSGVSWYNAISPDVIIGVLADQYRRQNTFARFLGSLSVAGKDGTLENRLRRGAARGRVFAKTGTITGVSTLSGYLHTSGGELLAFSIMVNHFPGKSRYLREIQDRLLEELVDLQAGE